MGLTYKSYTNAIRNYIRESEEIISKLESVKKFVENSRHDLNVVKTAGTTSGVAATVSTLGILFAPLTGGLSTIAAGVAIGGFVGSFGFAALSTVGETIDGKEAKKRIEVCQKRHEQSVLELRSETEKVCDIVNGLVDRGINFDAAIISTFAMLKDIGKSGGVLYDTTKAVAAIRAAIKAGQIQKILAPTGITITKTLQGGTRVVSYN